MCCSFRNMENRLKDFLVVHNFDCRVDSEQKTDCSIQIFGLC